ncbi:MAG: dihydroorotate dehydrogenase [Sphingomonadales bacterium]|jgi:dihydroorotate dehydrogenase|nr:dihydroorotate dehydrogenase [Sphingomonadales bacterium]
MRLQAVLYRLVRPLIFTLDAERAHRLTIAALRVLKPRLPQPTDPVLGIRVAGIDFPNPIGLAAGFDKDGEVFEQMLGFGFGFVEVGTLTPRPQSGNSRPRLFRLEEDRAVINRMGFNNGGLARLEARRTARRPPLREVEFKLRELEFKLSGRKPGWVGFNIGANKDSSDRVADYVEAVSRIGPCATYIAINVSSPNTPGLRALQDKGALDELLAAVVEARGDEGPPLFLKVAPDLEPGDVDNIVEVSLRRRLDALIVSNTTVSRPALRSRFAAEAGGLSGRPLKSLALERLRDFRKASGGEIPLVAVGGIESGTDAYERIRAGASLVQLYTALVYEGPGLARRIARELKALLLRDGFARLDEAVGSAAP